VSELWLVSKMLAGTGELLSELEKIFLSPLFPGIKVIVFTD